ncbi:MAG: TadG family pilus assembly protein [Candidatus Binatus sp.]|jgi:hypothetical protein
MKAKNESIVRIKESVVRGLRGGQRGQGVFGFLLLFAIGLLAVAALVIDAGRLYYGYEQLLAQTQTAALAAGSVLPNDTAGQAEATATDYSGTSGNLNAKSQLLQNVTIAFSGSCLSTLTNQGILCTTSPAGYNAMSVTETAQVPTTFARLLGVNSWNISATATAAAKGGYNGPYNIAVILDTTASMSDEDTDSNCNSTRISCALAGIQVLLSSLSPCTGGASCGTTAPSTAVDVYGVKGSSMPYSSYVQTGTEPASNWATAVDQVSLLVFPGFTAVSPYTADEYACPVNSSSIKAGVTPYNNGPVYQVIPLSSDYRTSDTLPSGCVVGQSGWPQCALNKSSNLVKVVGGDPSCSSGASNPGGEGTYYAGVIDTAQANLVANNRTNTKNVIVLLSDGAANAGQAPQGPSQMSGSVTKYPTTGNCAQAVTEAEAAAEAGTQVYTVAYGAEAGTSSCPTDTSPTMTPCQTMEESAVNPSASSPGYVETSQNFYSDYTAKGADSSCISASNPVSGLNQIFQSLAESLTVARLIPNPTGTAL